MCNRNHSRLVSHRICLSHTARHTHTRTTGVHTQKAVSVSTRTPTSMRSSRAAHQTSDTYSERAQPNRKTNKQLEIACDIHEENCQFRLHNFSAPNQPYSCHNKEKKQELRIGMGETARNPKANSTNQPNKKKIVPYAFSLSLSLTLSPCGTCERNEKIKKIIKSTG